MPLQDKKNDDNFFINYGNNRSFYIDELDKIHFLHKINIGTKEVAVYENYNYKPHIYLTRERETILNEVPYQKINYKRVSSTEYKIELKSIKKPVFVNFSETFHPDWKLKAGDFNWINVILKKHYFLDEKYHIKNNAGLNSFYIDPQNICKNYFCSKNPDGSYNLYMTLYFRAEAYMYLGIVVSGITLVCLLMYLFLRFKKYAKSN